MSTRFNPYSQWLGIISESGAITNYQLLGVKDFETDTDTIQTAANKRLEAIAEHLAGPHARLARRVKYEIESAHECLLDNVQRAAYDAMLRKRAAGLPNESVAIANESNSTQRPSAKRPQNSATHAALSSSPITQTSGFDTSFLESLAESESGAIAGPTLFISPPARKTSKATPFRRKVLATFMAVVPTFIAAVVLYFLFANRSEENIAATPEDAPRPASILDYAEPAPRKTEAPSRPQLVLTTPNQRANSPALVAPTAQNQKASALPIKQADEERIKQPAIVAQPKVLAPLVLPKLIDLPAFDESMLDQFTDLFPCNLPDNTECELTLENPSSETSGTNTTFDLLPSGAEQGLHAWLAKLVTKGSAVTDTANNQISVAEFALHEQTIRFRWLSAGRGASPQMIRNCVLCLTVNDSEHRITLRTPMAVAAVPIDLKKQTTIIPLPIDWMPKPSSLSIQFLALDGFSGKSTVPERTVEGTRTDLRIVLKEDVPQAELRLRLTTSGVSPSVRLTSVIVDRDGDLLPFTVDRINTMKRTIPQAVNSAHKRLQQSTARRSQLQAQYNALINTPARDAAAQGEKNVLVGSLQDDIQKALGAENSATKQVRAAETRQAVLPGLVTVMEKTNEHVILKYRVFYRVGTTEIDVLRVE